MIVWIASYPRSGNSLLRTVINQTLHIGTYDEYQVGGQSNQEKPSRVREIVGRELWEGDWQAFYEKATDAEDVFLVKTHGFPKDNQPAIYIVRDGRKAILSYSRYHRVFTQPPYPTLLEIILGLDYYGSWTQHYKAWAFREKTLVVKYEDLLKPTEKLLAQIATKTKYAGQIAPWENPFEELHRERPDLFGSGSSTWSETKEWPPIFDAIFFHIHGQLMCELGYMSETKIDETNKLMTQEMMDLLGITQRLQIENKRICQICDERLNLIDDLKKACDDRLSLINDLNKRIVCA